MAHLEAVEDLWEPWMRLADKALEGDTLMLIIQQELAQRCRKSKTRGRKATPAEVILRMLLLKHVRDWGCRGMCAPSWSIASSPGSAAAGDLRSSQAEAQRLDNEDRGHAAITDSPRPPSGRALHKAYGRVLARDLSALDNFMQAELATKWI